MFELVPAEGACSRGEDQSTRDVREDGGFDEVLDAGFNAKVNNIISNKPHTRV